MDKPVNVIIMRLRINMNKNEYVAEIEKVAKEFNDELVRAKIYFPDDKIGRAQYLIDSFEAKHFFYFSKEFKSSGYERGISPAPQVSRFLLDEDFKLLPKLSNKKGNIEIWPRAMTGDILSADILSAEILWRDGSGHRMREGLALFYEWNKDAITRETFKSNELFDVILSIWCIKKAQSGDKDSQKLLIGFFEKEIINYTRRFVDFKKIDSIEIGIESLAMMVFRTVVFGIDVKNYLSVIKNYEDMSAVDKVTELPVRKVIDVFLTELDKVPERLLVLSSSARKTRIKKGLEKHSIDAWSDLALLILDPIETLIVSGKMISPLYEPSKHGRFTNWLFGNRNLSKPTGAFMRRLYDFYKAKTEINSKGQRVPKKTDETMELLEYHKYSGLETYNKLKLKRFLSKEEVIIIVNKIRDYVKIKSLKPYKQQILEQYAVRKNIKKGFSLKKLLTTPTLAKMYGCSVKTTQRTIIGFERWSGSKL